MGQRKFSIFWEKKIRFLKKKISKTRNFFPKKKSKIWVRSKKFYIRIGPPEELEIAIYSFFRWLALETLRNQDICDLGLFQLANRSIKYFWNNSNFRFFWEKKFRFLKIFFSENRKKNFTKNRKIELGEKGFIGRLCHWKMSKSQISPFLAHFTREIKGNYCMSGIWLVGGRRWYLSINARLKG